MVKFTVASRFIAFLPQLQAACQALNLTLDETQQSQLLYYLQQLLFWNKAYNLTAIKDDQQALVKHIFDSLSIMPYVQRQNFSNLLDVGTGAGLPAVIVAICCPDLAVTALDSNSKKIRFIKQVASELGLKNITPTASRIEDHKEQYSAITSRAFASLTDFVELTQATLQVNGQILAMKGVLPATEIATLQTDWQITTEKLIVPMLDEVRHLIIIKH